jgi:hypothetical protein
MPSNIDAAARILVLAVLFPTGLSAFCGFYVGKADTKLFNESSKVVVVHHEDKTVISMANDYQGELKEFALVVPVPVVLQKDQVHIGDPGIFDALDAYSAPRLVEYFDPSPCNLPMGGAAMDLMAPMPAGSAMAFAKKSARERALGITVEASYTVGEYDIIVLSAKQSDGLETWLRENHYRIPIGASRALRPYIRQNMKFFVAKVNLKQQAMTGLVKLRPLQFAFQSPKFMLPLRLGMLNSRGQQDLVVYMLTMDGRVETTNYRTVKMPSGENLPEYVQNDFKHLYQSLFKQEFEREGAGVVFTEYFWNMAWCDPCAGTPLSREQLKGLGVFWLDQPMTGSIMRGPLNVNLTRLHVRYSPDTFPEDLVFQETQDKQNFQARYVIQHAWKGSAQDCPGAEAYLSSLKERHEKEAETLANLTGWDINDIRSHMADEGSEIQPSPNETATPEIGLPPLPSPTPWGSGLWK